MSGGYPTDISPHAPVVLSSLYFLVGTCCRGTLGTYFTPANSVPLDSEDMAVK